MSALSKKNGRLVKLIRSVPRHLSPVTHDLTKIRTECKGIPIHDQVPTVDFNTLHRRYAIDAFG